MLKAIFYDVEYEYSSDKLVHMFILRSVISCKVKLIFLICWTFKFILLLVQR